MLAGGLAFLREITDGSYYSAADISGHVGLPVIGHIPVLPAKHPDDINIDLAVAKIDPRICTATNRKGSRSEAFRSVRTAIYFNSQTVTNQILQVTSSTPAKVNQPSRPTWQLPLHNRDEVSFCWMPTCVDLEFITCLVPSHRRGWLGPLSRSQNRAANRV